MIYDPVAGGCILANDTYSPSSAPSTYGPSNAASAGQHRELMWFAKPPASDTILDCVKASARGHIKYIGVSTAGCQNYSSIPTGLTPK